jgi:hypothetical protein
MMTKIKLLGEMNISYISPAYNTKRQTQNITILVAHHYGLGEN